MLADTEGGAEDREQRRAWMERLHEREAGWDEMKKKGKTHP
jgi:hypothetical protein